MNRCQITTGVPVGGSGPSLPAHAAGVSTGVAEGGRVLFAPGGLSQHSAPLCLKPGHAAYISAYGLPADACIEVWRLVLRPGVIPSSDQSEVCAPGCLPAPTPAQVAYAKPLLSCGHQLVMLAADSDLVLEGPGCYQLRVSAASALTNLYVEASFRQSEATRS